MINRIQQSRYWKQFGAFIVMVGLVCFIGVGCSGDDETPTGGDNTVGSIAGSWGTGYISGESRYVSISLYPNGYYCIWDDNVSGQEGPPGVEYGTYTYNASTKKFKVTTIADNNGDAGSADNGVDQNADVQIWADGDVLRLSEAGDQWSFDRTKSATSPIVGGWGVFQYASSFPEYVSMTFYANGIFILWVSNDPNDANSSEGAEIGTYTYNVANNELVIVSVTRDDNGSDGFALNGAEENPGSWMMKCTVENDTLKLYEDATTVAWSGPRVK